MGWLCMMSFSFGSKVLWRNATSLLHLALREKRAKTDTLCELFLTRVLSGAEQWNGWYSGYGTAAGPGGTVVCRRRGEFSVYCVYSVPPPRMRGLKPTPAH